LDFKTGDGILIEHPKLSSDIRSNGSLKRQVTALAALRFANGADWKSIDRRKPDQTREQQLWIFEAPVRGAGDPLSLTGDD
jgi:hypothetical protein